MRNRKHVADKEGKVTTATHKINTFSNEMVMKASGSMIAPKEVMDKIYVLAPQAMITLESLLSAKAESVRLKAALEILALAGITKETRLTVTTQVQEMDDVQINDRLTQLLSRASNVVWEQDTREISTTTRGEE